MERVNPQTSRFLSQRRAIVAKSETLTGLERVSVERVQDDLWRLRLLFIESQALCKSSAPDPRLGPQHLRISTREGDVDPRLQVLEMVEQDRTVVVTLRLPSGAGDTPTGFVEIVGRTDVDPFFARIDFPESESLGPAVPAALASVEALVDSSMINYLARDYETFRRLMLDRMAEFIPEWAERNPADLGVAIIEVLAYAADYLSYHQDSIGVEAYLATARRRVSVHRHARLLDYGMHHGCNSRTFVSVVLPEADAGFELPVATQFLSASDESPGTSEVVTPKSPEYERALRSNVAVFESAYPVQLEPWKQELEIYTWGAEDFTLARGATTTTLTGRVELAQGDLLAFSKSKAHVRLEMAAIGGAVTSPSAGADSHVVRLSKAPKFGRDVATHREITEVAWHDEDALPFDFLVSRRSDGKVYAGLTRVTGNLVLADHGRTSTTDLPPVPQDGNYEPRIRNLESLTFRAPLDLERLRHRSAREALEQDPREALPVIYLEEENSAAGEVRGSIPEAWMDRSPRLPEDPSKAVETAVKAAVAAEEAAAAAAQKAQAAAESRERIDRDRSATLAAAERAVAEAKAAADAAATAAANAEFASHEAKVASWSVASTARTSDGVVVWRPRCDLIGCGPFDRFFVVELESNGDLTLRFGDGLQGRRPYAGTRFRAVYRVGSGPSGNMGADTLDWLVTSDWPVRLGSAEVTNPIPAVGGTAPEELTKVRHAAPAALRSERRCITVDDYAEAAEEHPEVLGAVARIRWTGSWHTVFLYVQRPEGKPVDDSFAAEIRGLLKPRMPIGAELQIRDPRWATLDIELEVTVAQGYLRTTVVNDLKARLGWTSSGSREPGFFAPDRWRFGAPVRLGDLVEAALEVRGVEAVVPTKFERKSESRGHELGHGEISLAPVEIAAIRPRIGGGLKIEARGGL